MLDLTKKELKQMFMETLLTCMETYDINFVTPALDAINKYLIELEQREKQLISLTQILDKRISLLEEKLND